VRDPNRIPVMMELLKTLWTRHPDLRLGQILVNARDTDHNVFDGDIFYTDDATIERGLRQLLRNTGGR
jgi:uncharacterized protein YihD (DUF1040 family)